MERQPGNLLRPETVLIKENDLKSNIQSDFQLPTFGKDRLERARTCAETACPRELFNRSVYDPTYWSDTISVSSSTHDGFLGETLLSCSRLSYGYSLWSVEKMDT